MRKVPLGGGGGRGRGKSSKKVAEEEEEEVWDRPAKERERASLPLQLGVLHYAQVEKEGRRALCRENVWESPNKRPMAKLKTLEQLSKKS